MSILVTVIAIVSSWSVGQEVEVGPGVYAKLQYEADGWRVWRFEQRNGYSCVATKGPNGDNIVPLGFSDVLFGPTLWIEIRNREKWWTVAGSGDGAGISFRNSGARFYSESLGYTFPAPTIEGKMDFIRNSYRYPRSRIGFETKEATIDLVGMGNAKINLQYCNGR